MAAQMGGHPALVASDCDSLRSLHKFALAKSEIWTLTYRTFGFSSITIDTKRRGS